MSSTGASSSSRGKRKASNSISRAEKVALQFPVARVNRYLKEGKYASRIYGAASVYLTAVLEYLAAEVLKLAGDKAKENNKTKILPSHLKSAIQNDEELMKILGGDITIPDSGVLHKIHQALLPKIIAEREKEAMKKATK